MVKELYLTEGFHLNTYDILPVSQHIQAHQLTGYLEEFHTDACSLTRKLRDRMCTYVDVETDGRISTNIF